MKYSLIKGHKKILIITAAVFLMALAGYAVYAFTRTNNEPERDTDTSINYDPPTEQEQKSGDDKKEEIVENDNSNSEKPGSEAPESSDKKTASVIITFAEQQDQVIEVNAFVNNHIQEGTCTLHFQKDSQTVTRQVPAHPDASSTICTNPLINRSEFPSAGIWSLKVTYESASAKGTSKSINVRVN